MTSRNFRLVSPDDNVDYSATSPLSRLRESGQLSFQFDDPDLRRIAVLPMDDFHGERLHSLVKDLRPTVAVDLRYSIRFDLPGSNRGLFFQQLEKFKTFYIRSPVEWHQLDHRPFTTDAALITYRLHHEVVERTTGNILLLVAKGEHCRYLASALNLALSLKQSSGWRIEYSS